VAEKGGEEKNVEKAATTIQATFRGYKTRKQITPVLQTKRAKSAEHEVASSNPAASVESDVVAVVAVEETPVPAEAAVLVESEITAEVNTSLPAEEVTARSPIAEQIEAAIVEAVATPPFSPVAEEVLPVAASEEPTVSSSPDVVVEVPLTAESASIEATITKPDDALPVSVETTLVEAVKVVAEQVPEEPAASIVAALIEAVQIEAPAPESSPAPPVGESDSIAAILTGTAVPSSEAAAIQDDLSYSISTSNENQPANNDEINSILDLISNMQPEEQQQQHPAETAANLITSAITNTNTTTITSNQTETAATTTTTNSNSTNNPDIEAATKIQATYRGFRTRKQLGSTKGIHKKKY
jgi:hypothetical protein